MNNRLRSTVAAAMLLAPVAATLIAEPAAAQQRATVAQPSITQMALNSDAGISPGATLRVQVVGTPNARSGSLTLGSSGISIPLRQQGAGSYSGSYVVRRADRIDPTELLTARLTFGDRTFSRQFNYPTAFQALAMGASRGPDRDEDRRAGRDERDDRRAARDEHSPDITDMIPANGERVGERGRTRIAARLSDHGSGVDPRSVHLRLNGRDVTADARVSEDEISYRTDLDPGRYTAEVVVRDQAGNSTRKAWTFDVTAGGDRQSDRGYERQGNAGPLPLDVTSHQNNMVIDARGNLAIQGRTVPNATVRVQVDSVANIGGSFGVTQPVADHTVQADRNGYFSVGVSPRGGLPIPGTRYDVRVTSTSGPQTAEERLTLIQRQG
jgi:hypothetical protein